MPSPLNNLIEQWKREAIHKGEINADTSAQRFAYEISRQWRRLVDGGGSALPPYTRKEMCAARIAAAALKYLKIKNPKVRIDHILKCALRE